eukprot:TRINITY_DN7634_c0_g2_i3.p1 TRINITY_DN7634_c0_g2~~TRINITY_DN7634_c0_g2_i3.p1  ORF type:complete len:708 (+),score=173.80 TRINITY_DN7634_c0_g2_i3:357-2480(+)
MEKDLDDEEIKSGLLHKKESRKWSEKWFVLTSSRLLWYNSKKDRAAKKRPKGNVPIDKVNVKLGREHDSNTLSDAPNGIGSTFALLQSDGSTLSLCASGEEDCSFWVDVLNSASAGRKDLTKETVAIQEELRKSGVHEISPEALDFEEKVIGSGASGIVKRGLWLKSTEVAVKVLKNVPEFTERRDLLSFYKEIETLSKLRHSNIVQMYGFCRKESYLCLVTEFVRGGNLADCLEDNDNYELDFYLQLELALSITRGMVYLHACGIVHRDLKPANILVESWDEAKVKVCDFGISKAIVRKKDQAQEAEGGLGSPQYAAPELSSDSHDNKVDVFSFAIIMWEIALRKTPWPEIKFGSQFAERYQKGERPEIPDSCQFKTLLEQCWAQQPSKRPSFGGVYEMLEQLRNRTPQRVKSLTGRSMSSLSLRDHQPNKPLPVAPTNGLKIPVKGAKTALSPPGMRHTSSSMSLIPTSPTSPSSPHSSKPPPIPGPRTECEGTVWKAFSGKAAIPWEVFVGALANGLALDTSQVQRLKFVFEKDGVVERQTWETFLIWFSPLGGAENIYQTGNAVTDGYEARHVLSICTPGWFHGFLSSADAQKALKGKADGTFLFRFSTTNPGCYALTVAYSNTVGHWRISCEKKPNEDPLYFIDGRQYKSLDEIIQTHRIGREALNIKSPKPNQATTCFLGSFHPREEEGDNQYYQNVQVKR